MKRERLPFPPGFMDSTLMHPFDDDEVAPTRHVRVLTVRIHLDEGTTADLEALADTLIDWVMEEGRISDDRFKFGVSTALEDDE